VTFLAYIATGVASIVVFGRATSGQGIEAKLAEIAQHATDGGVVVVLGLLQCFAALVLAVTLYAITREQDPDLAMLALTCRVGEGLIGATSIPSTPALLWLATAGRAEAPFTSLMWLPMLAFEVPLALWLLIKGVAVPVRTRSA
jgi:hypothetical protein